MLSYRRHYVPDGTYFFTVRLQDKCSHLLTERIDLMRAAVRLALKRWPFRIEEAVVLPNMTHMIWILPEGDTDFSKRWRLIKSTFSRHVPAPDFIPQSQKKRGEKGIWQRRFWEHCIRDTRDYDLHRHLITMAPVQAGLVKRPGDWPYSSLSTRKMGLDPSSLKTTDPAPSTPNRTIAETAS